jgi:hypothetical protein
MKVVCAHCGLPFSVGRAEPGRAMYCCSGCALASRMTTGAGGGSLAMNATLATALGVGFVFFNQVLGWLLAVALARSAAEGGVSGPGDMENAARLAWASLAVGVAVWLALAVSQVRAGARRGRDALVLVATGALVACAVAGESAGGAVAGNAALATWALRGLIGKRGA